MSGGMLYTVIAVLVIILLVLLILRLVRGVCTDHRAGVLASLGLGLFVTIPFGAGSLGHHDVPQTSGPALFALRPGPKP
jgi:hypothetical protein